jgi:hypothetical protein
MSDGDRDRIIEALRQLYQKSTVARAVIGWFGSRQNNSAETSVEAVDAALKRAGHHYTRAEIIEALRQVAAVGCGEVVVGRKGHPTRLVWASGVSLTEAGKAAAAQTVGTAPTTNGYSPNGIIEHSYHLRIGAPITLRLPSDLTQSEADRLADFVRTLPIR